MGRKLLSDAEVTAALTELPGWERNGNVLSRTFDRRTFNGAVAFVSTLSELAERMNHHPDLDIRYSKVKVMLSTHDAGGLTEDDLTLARRIHAAAE